MAVLDGGGQGEQLRLRPGGARLGIPAGLPAAHGLQERGQGDVGRAGVGVGLSGERLTVHGDRQLPRPGGLPQQQDRQQQRKQCPSFHITSLLSMRGCVSPANSIPERGRRAQGVNSGNLSNGRRTLVRRHLRTIRRSWKRIFVDFRVLLLTNGDSSCKMSRE